MHQVRVLACSAATRAHDDMGRNVVFLLPIYTWTQFESLSWHVIPCVDHDGCYTCMPTSCLNPSICSGSDGGSMSSGGSWMH